MEKCETCQFWRKIRDDDLVLEDGEVWVGPHGECHLIDEFSTDKAAWLAANEGDDTDMSLITRSNFGCNQWMGQQRIGGDNQDVMKEFPLCPHCASQSREWLEQRANDDLMEYLETLTTTQLREYIQVSEKVSEERLEVLEAIPPCPMHGAQCVPHALEWIKRRTPAERQEEYPMRIDDIDTIRAGLNEMKEKARRGEAFLEECRIIIAECASLEERAARAAVFSMCVMLDGSGEHIGPDYVLSVRNEGGELESVTFDHHEL